MCAVITCPSSPVLTYATRSTNLAIFDTVVVYQCLPGYRFADNSSVYTIVCQGAGVWNDTVTDCQRTCHSAATNNIINDNSNNNNNK